MSINYYGFIKNVNFLQILWPYNTFSIVKVDKFYYEAFDKSTATHRCYYPNLHPKNLRAINLKMRSLLTSLGAQYSKWMSEMKLVKFLDLKLGNNFKNFIIFPAVGRKNALRFPRWWQIMYLQECIVRHEFCHLPQILRILLYACTRRYR